MSPSMAVSVRQAHLVCIAANLIRLVTVIDGGGLIIPVRSYLTGIIFYCLAGATLPIVFNFPSGSTVQTS